MVDGRGEAMDQGAEKGQGSRRLFLERVQGLSVQMSALQDTLMMGYGPNNTGYRYSRILEKIRSRFKVGTSCEVKKKQKVAYARRQQLDSSILELGVSIQVHTSVVRQANTRYRHQYTSPAPWP